MMVVEYDCAKDNYYKAERQLLKEGFLCGVYSSQNIGRKVEADWNMVYIARREGNCDRGEVTWKFQLQEGQVVTKVELLVGSCCYEDGQVTWQLCGESSCLLPTPGMKLETEQLAGSNEIQLTARMNGGQGENAWQHTQLFRWEIY